MKQLLLILAFALLLVSCQDKIDPVSNETEAPKAFHKSPDGADQLGPIEIPLESGTGIATAGIGLQNGDDYIDLSVPAGATIKQVLLYWSGGFPSQVKDQGTGDNEITIEGNSVTGTLIGGPTWFFYVSGEGHFNWTTYRADITSLNLVAPGENSLLVGDLEYGSTENNGAGLIVVYDESGQSSELAIVDGQDLAYEGFDTPEYRNATVPQTFAFTSSNSDRTGQLSVFCGSVYDDDDRASIIRVTPDNGPAVDYQNILSSNDGEAWDTAVLEVEIPAGATSLTVELISGGSDVLQPASLVWIASSFSVSKDVNKCWHKKPKHHKKHHWTWNKKKSHFKNYLKKCYNKKKRR